jgi:hypothetical protein
MPASSSARNNNKPMPKGYTVHEPVAGSVPGTVLQQRFEKLEKLLMKAKKEQLKNLK